MEKRIKVDFLAPPFEGHLNPLIEMAEKLKDKYDIRFITGKNKNEVLIKSGFTVENILIEENEMFEKISDTEEQVKINFFALKKQFSENLKLIPKAKHEIKELIIKNETDIIIADYTVIPAVLCSRDIGLPIITTMPTNFIIENKDGTPAYFGGLKPLNSIYGNLRDFVARKQIKLFKKIIYYMFYNRIKKLDFTLYNEKGEENLYSQHSILGLGMEEFEYERTWPIQYKFAGSCPETPEYYSKKLSDENIETLLGKHYKRKVLVTLGTHLKWAKKTLLQDIEEIARNFENTLFVVTMGKIGYEINKLNTKSNNVMIVEYLSYTDYLKEFDYVIHHGGAGITYNCIKCKIPSLVIPHDYDQFDYAARIEYFDVGIRIKNRKNIEDIVKKINILFERKDWKNLEKLSNDFKKYYPHETLDEEIQRLLSI